MASTVLMRDALWRISTLLTDVAPQFHRNPEHDLVDCVNDAQVAITTFIPSACSRVDAIRLRPGTLQSIESIAPAYCKPGDGSTPAVAILGTQVLRPVCNMGADGLTPGRIVRVVDSRTQDVQNPFWHVRTGLVVREFSSDPSTPHYFSVSPGVDGSTPVWLRLAYTAQPLKIPNTGTSEAPLYAFAGSSTQTITIADEYLDAIVNYTVAKRCLTPNEWSDASKGAAFAALFTDFLNAKVTALTGHNPNLKRLPFAPQAIGMGS